MKPLILLLVLFLLASCKNVQTNEQTANTAEQTALDSVNILVESKSEYDLTLTYCDDFGNATRLQKGFNRVPRLMSLKDEGNTRVFYFLRFCTSQNITFSINSLGHWTAKTENEADDNSLNFFIRLVEAVKPRYSPMDVFLHKPYADKSFLKNPKARTALIDADFDKKSHFLANYALKNKLSQNISANFQKVIEYEKLESTLILSGNIQNWDKAYLSELAKNIDKFQNDSLLFIPYYQRGASSINYLIEYLTYNATETKSATNILTNYKTITDNFSGKTRDFLQTNLLVACKDKYLEMKYTPEQYKTLSNQFMADCKTLEYKNYIKGTITDYSTFKNGQLMSTTKQITTFDSLIQQNAITYIDFWASWCIPCRAEMPASLQLRADYASKGIHFVYVSMDSDAGAWLKISKQVGLPESDSYLLPNGKASSISKQLKINTIPRYVWVDKKGEIIDTDAYRPSKVKIRKQFDALLTD